MPKRDALTRIKAIVFALPETKLTMTWGKPHFRVGEKIFCGFGEEQGRATLGFKLEMAHARAVNKRPGFRPAAYVGHKGWVSMDISPRTDWNEAQSFIRESYRLIAPKKLAAALSSVAPPRKSTKKKATKKKRKAKARQP